MGYRGRRTDETVDKAKSTLPMGINGSSDDEQGQTYMQTICGHWMNETLTFQTSAQFHTFLAAAPRPIHNTTVLLSWYNGGAAPTTLIGYPIGSSMMKWVLPVLRGRGWYKRPMLRISRSGGRGKRVLREFPEAERYSQRVLAES
ncbi:hypothetical protein SISNIDRAFT_518965 [Sistotremastrum niveocremeum HHB9708]|uniref:Uncharacterized protein n=1 Tax=Sistotremastrum niveocremeum HHB9708 TaxID=1314777 RepID=A0A164RQX4_9AGAM|nr:hypothetical protein SISNIDRAFT_518965 [Sistotremastrum niveocremeum HHB9708]